VPSKVFLDEPYPSNLPVVEACEKCNNSFSRDELYLACFIESAICGTTSPNSVQRQKIRRSLIDNPKLAQLIERSCTQGPGGELLWMPEVSRVENVLLKLARGHAIYEYAESRTEPPTFSRFAPLVCFTESERGEFECFDSRSVLTTWPEIGSRAFLRIFGDGSEFYSEDGWIDIQSGRYRYAVTPAPTTVRFVIREYLACEVIWD